MFRATAPARAQSISLACPFPTAQAEKPGEAVGLVTYLQAAPEFSLGEWPGLLGQKGAQGVALGQCRQLGGVGGAVDANEDEQGLGQYEPDSWILCKGRVRRVTFRAGPTWDGPVGAYVVRHILPPALGPGWEGQQEAC